MITKALYAGSFDPLTLGHLDIIERAANIFDEVVVGVVVNLEKKTMFNFEERMDMIKEVTGHLPNVTVDMCDGLLADALYAFLQVSFWLICGNDDRD